MIPKVIHYCWFGGKPLPSDVKKCIASWKKYCPQYKIIRWDESNFDINCHPFVQAAYAAKAWAFVSDYARLKVIYENGGIYLDTDVELVKGLDSLLENQCYLGVQFNGWLCATGLGFGAVPSSPVVYAMMKKYDLVEFNINKKNKLSCPWLNHEIICSLGYKNSNDIVQLKNVTIYPPRYFDPYPSGVNKCFFGDDTVSIHHYAASWTTGRQRIKRKIARLLGEKTVFLIKKIMRKK